MVGISSACCYKLGISRIIVLVATSRIKVLGISRIIVLVATSRVKSAWYKQDNSACLWLQAG